MIYGLLSRVEFQAFEKLTRIASMNACRKCAGFDHNTKQCNFKLKKSCLNCGEWHFVFLCPNMGKKAKSQSSTVFGNGLHGSTNRDSILPTFVCTSKSNDHLKIRGLRDTGSQSNLISETMLRKLDHEVLADDIDLDLNGINLSKFYKSKLVRLSLMFGNRNRFIYAFVLPSLDIVLKLPGLSNIVRNFVSKGYKLADDFLLNGSDIIDNLDLLLGTGAAYCFIDQTIAFGRDSGSVYSNCDIGVMLLGSITEISGDIEVLPLADVSSSDVPRVSTSVSVNCSFVNIGSNLNSCNLYSSNFFVKGNSSPDSKKYVDQAERALEENLERECDIHLHKDKGVTDEIDSELNRKLIHYLLSNITRKSDGRLVIPLLWNGKVSHLLSHNMYLAQKILESGTDKLIKAGHMELVNDSVRELIAKGFVERIPDLDSYIARFPNYSFLAHMCVIKLARESTKCRIVMLANL